MKTKIVSKKSISNYKKHSRLVLNGRKCKYTKQRGGANVVPNVVPNVVHNFTRKAMKLTPRILPILPETKKEKNKRENKARQIGKNSFNIINSYSNKEKNDENVIKRMKDNHMTIIEVSSLYLGVAYFTKTSQLGFGINIFNLHVDLLQYIINNGFLSEYKKPVSKLETIYGKDNNKYLCINNLPCLTCSISPFITYKKANNPLNEDKKLFYDVYEPSLNEIKQNSEKYKPRLTEEECYNNYRNIDKKKTSYECIVYKSTSEDKSPIENKSYQDIEYVRLIAEYLSASKEEKKTLKCDFSDIPEEYVITDESINIESIDYLICGYPEKKMVPYLQVLKLKQTITGDTSGVKLDSYENQEKLIEDEINIIHEEHKTYFSDYMAMYSD